ncbi:hypothetical protein E2C01_096745 [Portunus trituberculatus]|uniref:Uncharacterized protein n=1 Tax=Portunus trituberculatus TaxID=210409 RepID=A0A5B7K3W2_PORTR|nr:hypothetical protein [Portunus trituberculatus]
MSSLERQCEEFEHFTVKGKVKLNGDQEKEIKILRDTVANQCLILHNILPWCAESDTGRKSLAKGLVEISSYPFILCGWTVDTSQVK